MGKHFYEWPMEGSNVWWPLEREGKTSFSPPFIFHPIKFYLNIFFIDFKVSFYHGFRHYFVVFLPFPWSINYNHTSWGTNFFTHSSLNRFWSKIFFLFLNSWCFAWLRLTGLKPHKWTKNHLESRSKFKTNLTPLWWKSQTMKSVPLFQSRTSSSLVLLNFSKLSYLSDFVASWSCFWWWTWNFLQRFLQNCFFLEKKNKKN